MSEDLPVHDLLEQIGNESEAQRHTPLPVDAVGRRKSAARAPKVLSVRLTAEQYERLAESAALRDLPVSTMARLAIIEQLDAQPGPSRVTSDLTAITEALREVIRPEFLRAG